MPLIIRCKECGYMLYEGKWIVKLYMSPLQKIMNIHEGRCPKCGRELEMPSSKDITILPNFEYFPKRKGEEVKDDNV